MRVTAANTELHLHIESLAAAPEHRIEAPTSFSTFRAHWNALCWSFRNIEEVCALGRRAISYIRMNRLAYAEFLFTPVGFEADGGRTDKVYAAWLKAFTHSGLTDRVRILLDFPYGYDPRAIRASLQIARPFFGTLIGGISLGGEELPGSIRGHSWLAEIARDEGLLFCQHLGESLTSPQNLEDSISLLRPTRIAHATRLLAIPGTMNLLREASVCVDLCPIANVCLGLIRTVSDLPYEALREQGIAFSVNSDDPGIFGCSFRSLRAALPRALPLSTIGLEAYVTRRVRQ